MTTNQIDYYNARMKAKNDRLTRKEQKRHNLASEQAQNLSASAAISQAAAAQSQANTAQKRYQLEWEGEYGFPYGTPQEQMSNRDNWRLLTDEEVENSTKYMPNTFTVPQTYAKTQFQIMKDLQQSQTEVAKRTGTYSKALSDLLKGAEAGAKTYVILTE